jgi:hypothetical protein
MLIQRTFTSRLEAAGSAVHWGSNGFRGFEGLRLATLSPEMEAIFEREDAVEGFKEHYPQPRAALRQNAHRSHGVVSNLLALRLQNL